MIMNHVKICNNSIVLDNFNIIGKMNNLTDLRILGSLYIFKHDTSSYLYVRISIFFYISTFLLHILILIRLMMEFYPYYLLSIYFFLAIICSIFFL